MLHTFCLFVPPQTRPSPKAKMAPAKRQSFGHQRSPGSACCGGNDSLLQSISHEADVFFAFFQRSCGVFLMNLDTEKANVVGAKTV